MKRCNGDAWHATTWYTIRTLLFVQVVDAMDIHHALESVTFKDHMCAQIVLTDLYNSSQICRLLNINKNFGIDWHRNMENGK